MASSRGGRRTQRPDMPAGAMRKGAAMDGRPVETVAAKPKICFVAPHAWPVLARDASLKMVGGAEVQQTILARALARAGYRVSIISNDFGQPNGAEVDGVVVYKTHPLHGGIPVVRFLHPRLTTTLRALREADADIYYQ